MVTKSEAFFCLLLQDNRLEEEEGSANSKCGDQSIEIEIDQNQIGLDGRSHLSMLPFVVRFENVESGHKDVGCSDNAIPSEGISILAQIGGYSINNYRQEVEHNSWSDSQHTKGCVTADYTVNPGGGDYTVYDKLAEDEEDEESTSSDE